LFILWLILCPSLVSAAHIVSVQSVSIAPYNEAFRGLESGCRCDLTRYVLSDMKGYDIVKELRRQRPDAIVAIGSSALEHIRAIRDIPIIYLMVLDPQSLIAGNSNISGINMNIPPDKQLELIRRVMPEVKDIGVLYSPGQKAGFIEKAKTAAEKAGINLITNEVRTPGEVPELLNHMAGKIKAFWMLPDVGVYSPESVEALLLYSIKHRLPVITFSNKYLDMGATLSLEIDPYDMGLQAAGTAAELLSGKQTAPIPYCSARKTNITVNERIIKKMDVKDSTYLLTKAKELTGANVCFQQIF